MVAATQSVAQARSDGACFTPASGKITTPTAANANGNKKKTGRLSAVSPSATPSAANDARLFESSARIAIHIDTVNRNVVHSSVMISAPKYGIGGNRAVAAAATIATRSPATRRAIAYTTTHMTAKSTV